LPSSKSSIPQSKKSPPEDPLELVENELDSPRMSLPSKKDDLFVLKNVGRYQTELSVQQSHFTPDPNTPIKQ